MVLLDPCHGLVLTATDAENYATTYTYDLNGNAETITNARGYLTRTGYDVEDRKLLTTVAEGTPEARTTGVVLYDKVGNPVQVRDGNGNVRVIEFNALNLPSKQYDPAPFAAQFVEITYNKNGKPVAVKNRRGFTTTTEYDELGRVTLVTDPAPFDSQTIVTTYDKVGNVKTVKDKRGIVTSNVYDGLNRLTEQSRAGVRLVTNEYDANGNQTATIDAEDNRTEFTYTPRNLLDVTTFADTTTQSRGYDGVGNLLTLTDEEGKVTTSTYDNENRVKTITFAGETTENHYDEVGNRVEVINPKLNSRVMTYDGLGRLATVREGSLTTTYGYDANGNRLSEEDPLGHRVEFTYDELNRKKQHIQRKSGGDLTVRYDLYDAEGNLKQLTDAKGQLFSYDYDELNRPVKTTYPAVTTPFLTLQRIETGYDANNNVATVTESKAQSGGGTITDVTTNSWDDFDRLDNSIQRGVLLDYGYDKNGNRTSVATANGSTTYTFDDRNRLETAVVGADITIYTYTPDGRTETVSYPNGTATAYSYYPSNRVETITHKDNTAATISSFAYQYDDNGNRTQQIEVQGGVSETTDYGYDDLDRLEGFTLTIGADTMVTAYTFEGYNRKTESVTVNGATTVNKTYSYDATNWLTSLVDTAPPTPVTIAYQYDANGNSILKTDSSKPGEDLAFDYDVANRMVQTRKGATLLGKYDYNAEGLRVRHYGSERGEVEYFYDDDAVLEEYVAGVGGGLLAHYRYGDRLLSLDAPNDGGVQYYHHDALGSMVNLTDSSGGTKVSYSLDPWGHIRNQVGSSVNRQVFTGQEHDEQTGLIYFGARYYDPDTGRFLTQDSYLGEPGTPPSLHRYLYAYANPTVYVDLMGYLTWDEAKDGIGNSWTGIKGGLSGAAQALPGAYAMTNAAFDESLNNAYAKGVENGVPGLDNDVARVGLAAATTLTKGVMGMGSAPLSKAVETIEYAKDTSQLQNFPIIATRLRDTCRASEAFAQDGSFANGVNLVGAASGVIVETAAVGYGVKSIAETAASPKSGITVENPKGATFEGNIYRSVKNGYDPLEMNSYDVKLNNMLDLSNKKVRSDLRVHLDDLLSNDYKTNIGDAITHKVGEFAKQNIYNGILAPSSRADGGLNVIIFDPKIIK